MVMEASNRDVELTIRVKHYQSPVRDTTTQKTHISSMHTRLPRREVASLHWPAKYEGRKA